MKILLSLPAAALLVLTAPAFAQDAAGSKFISSFDINEDGEVTLAEARQKRSEIFYMLDQDEDGVLSSAEYDLFDDTRAADHEGACANGGHGQGQGQGQGRAPGSGMAREVTDLNGDGVVSEQEFLDSAESWFLQKDRNGDNVITSADFGPAN